MRAFVGLVVVLASLVGHSAPPAIAGWNDGGKCMHHHQWICDGVSAE